jgi:magnesium chelatase family protein
VEAARDRQRHRAAAGFPRSNAELAGEAIRAAADPTPAAVHTLSTAMERLGFSARAWARLLKVARTLADLDGTARVDVPHVLEAATYRGFTGVAGGAP